MSVKRMRNRSLALTKESGSNEGVAIKKRRPATRALTRIEVAHIRKRLAELLVHYKTQTLVAQKIGISQQVVGHIMHGQPCGLYVARRLAKHDNVSVEALLKGIVPELEKVLAEHPDRWPSAIVNFVRELATSVWANTDQDWLMVLDDAFDRFRMFVYDKSHKR